MRERAVGEQAAQGDRNDEADAPLAASPLVIAIDDTPQAITLVQLACRQTQPLCSMLTAGSGVAGLELVTAHAAEVRVVVLDVRMPDLDGRWLCSEVRRLAPQAQVLPFTGDEAGGALMGRFGALPPLIKPASVSAIAGAISTALTLPPPTTADPELAAFFAEQMPQQIAGAQQRGQQVRVALLASEHLRLVLRAVLPAANGAIVTAGTDPAELHPFLASRLVQALVASADCWKLAHELATATHIPLLICATTAEARTIPAALNVVSSIASPDVLSAALCTVATGARYREAAALHPLLAALSPREQRVVGLIRAGHTPQSLAAELRVSYDHTRHLLSKLYKHFAVSTLDQLRAWLTHHG